MGIMQGKKGIIFGVSNAHGIAYGIAKQLFDQGADIAFTYAGEVMEKRVNPLTDLRLSFRSSLNSTCFQTACFCFADNAETA